MSLEPDENKNIYEKTALYIAKMLEEKNKSYGNAYGKAPDFLSLLYPDGVSPDQYKDMLFVLRIFDKLMRIANQKGAFNEDAYMDGAGYFTLALIEDERTKEENQPV
jgi:hypothetical protein